MLWGMSFHWAVLCFRHWKLWLDHSHRLLQRVFKKGPPNPMSLKRLCQDKQPDRVTHWGHRAPVSWGTAEAVMNEMGRGFGETKGYGFLRSSTIVILKSRVGEIMCWAEAFFGISPIEGTMTREPLCRAVVCAETSQLRILWPITHHPGSKLFFLIDNLAFSKTQTHTYR